MTSRNDRTGDLCNADTGEYIRQSTAAETIQSRWEARGNHGAGVILVDGARCYVEGDEDPDFELCTNAEWIAQSIDLEDVEECLRDEAAAWFVSRLGDKLEKAGFTWSPPSGTRGTFHGWNGANVHAWKSGALGTFDSLADWEKSLLMDLLGEAEKDTVAEWK